MIKNYLKINLVMVIAVFAMPALVSANECLTPVQATDSSVENNGFAVAVQADQGQGAIDCSAFIGKSGDPMVPAVGFTLTEGANGSGVIGTIDNPVRWESSDPTDPETNIRVVFIGNSDGSRCTQFYTENAVSGYAGAGTKTNKASTVVACTDGFTDPVEPPPPPPPVPPITTTDDCSTNPNTKDFQAAINNNPDYDWVILGGRNTAGGAEGNTAICVDQGIDAGDGQGKMDRCVERCITPDPLTSGVPWYPLDDPARDPGGVCDGTLGPDGDGRFPIECRVCELSSEAVSDLYDPQTPFCWEQGQNVQPFPFTGTSGTFKLPQPEQGEQGWTIKGRKGSTCYLISGRTQSGWPYAYWTPSGCPN